MKNIKEKYTDNSGDKKYFAMIPYYIVNHSSAYEQSLYLVMKRIASEEGTCWASPITIGKMMEVSPNTVRKYRDKLLKRGWIKKIGIKGKTKPTDDFEIVDLWKLNMDYYAQKESSTGEQSKRKFTSCTKKVQLVNLESSTGGNKEEIIKKKPKKDTRFAKSQTERKLNKFRKEEYAEILDEYQLLKGIELKGQEFSPCQQAIKTMFLSSRSKEDIVACMRWFAERAGSGEKDYEWTQNWTLNTIKIKLPEFLAGKLTKGGISVDDIEIPEYAKKWQKYYAPN